MKIEIELKAHKDAFDWWDKRNLFRRKFEEALAEFFIFAGEHEYEYLVTIEDGDLPPEP